MGRYAVLLRGVNVGGVTVRSADLRALLAELPLSDVSTLLASGNVVCRYDGDARALKELVEAALRERFGYDAWVVVLTAERLAELLDACPYPADSETHQTYVTVTSDPARLDELDEAIAEAAPDAPRVRLGPEAAAWQAVVGGTLDDPQSKAGSKPRYKPWITDRNLRTMLKIRAALEKLPA
ncbi:DUF1697 domain-containing protein [Actinotalea ferrariae]|uniref:DUF1697 domain-containing protein n=1 Tax=Actinotalea ferrariae TaxID=1386098 RepID=UPI001C8BA7C0|nr:DUF1697 domain-containing protein [Actinotalea ferrariae]MBX9246600.1 DUF1697 domain-containing protein [Actinotalea ferrariae]